MTILFPNLPKWVFEEKPNIVNCKYCGAEAELKGKPDWEWWTYEIGCSAYCLESSKNHTRLDRYDIKELIEKWNKLNEENNND